MISDTKQAINPVYFSATANDYSRGVFLSRDTAVAEICFSRPSIKPPRKTTITSLMTNIDGLKCSFSFFLYNYQRSLRGVPSSYVVDQNDVFPREKRNYLLQFFLTVGYRINCIQLMLQRLRPTLNVFPNRLVSVVMACPFLFPFWLVIVWNKDLYSPLKIVERETT